MVDKIKDLPEHFCLCFKVCVVKIKRKIADRKEHSDIMLLGSKSLLEWGP